MADNVNQDERLAALLWRAARASTRYYQAQLAELDLTTRQAAAILALVEAPGVTLGALAEALRADQATASAVVDRLLAADLVKRETDPVDRRRARLYPTDRALQIAERLDGARRRTEVMLEEILGPATARKLRKVLHRLSEELERERVAVAAGQGGAA
ncbi:MAG TPA: MarR family transcriptional regulator [Dehalococcoidia bacterium]|nr:MarR family transcriptional regulator [Dehalococcoidia bacterium]